MKALGEICRALHCRIEYIVEYIPDKIDWKISALAISGSEKYKGDNIKVGRLSFDGRPTFVFCKCKMRILMPLNFKFKFWAAKHRCKFRSRLFHPYSCKEKLFDNAFLLREEITMGFPKNINIGVPDICAHITSRIKSSRKVILTGYAKSTISGVRIGLKHQRSFDPTIADENYEAEILANIIEKEYKKQSVSGVAKSKSDGTSGVYTATYKVFRELGIHNPDWDKDTMKWTCTYFENRILRRLDELGIEADSADFAEIKDALVEKTLKSKRSNGDPVTANKSVSQYLLRANWILKQLYELNPELPNRLFNTEGIEALPMADQVKYIPDDVRVKFAYLLTKMLHYGLTMGAGLMETGGTRTAEACAVKIGEISLRDRYVVIPILYQIKNGNRIPRLKTNAAYRYCICGSLMHHLIVKRMEYLSSLGYTDEDIAEMPLVSYPDDPCRYADPSSLSAFVRELLQLCGFKKKDFRLIAALTKREPDLDSDGVPETDVSAYALRRDWAGRAIHLCGMTSADVDYLMGHKNSEAKGRDYTNYDLQTDIAKQLERHVFLPAYSRHPYYNAICPGLGKTVDLVGYSGYRITAGKEPIEVTLRVTTSESGNRLVFTTDGTVVSPPELQTGAKDSLRLRENRPMIGSVTSSDEYRKWIAEAERIDISKWSDKRGNEK